MKKSKKLAMAVLAAGIAATALAGTSASAATRSSAPASVRPAAIQYDVKTTPKGARCYAAVDAELRSNGWYTRARFYSKGVACTGSLQREKYGSKTYKRISNYYTTGGNPSGAGSWASTGWHYDGGYRSRACSYADQNLGGCTGGF